MSGYPISMQEWLQHASPNSPLALLRDEARALVDDATRFVSGLDDAYFEMTNEVHQYAADEEWDYLYSEDEGLD